LRYSGRPVSPSISIRIVHLPENIRVRCDDATEPVEERGAALEADERVVGRNLEAFGQILGRQRHQYVRIDAERILRLAGKGTAHEHIEACHRKSLGADIGLARAALLIAPLRAGARIEQHGDDGEVESRTSHVGGFFPGRAVHHRIPAIMTSGGEVAPAGMERDVEGRIGLPDRGHYLVSAGIEPSEIDREMLETAFETCLQKLVRPFPHRSGREKASGGFGVR
jgi:hypothetical protein